MKLGDVFSVKSFAERRVTQDGKSDENREERKRKLLSILEKKVDASTSKRKCTKLSSSKTGKQKTRRILLGMMCFDIKKKKYTRVSLVKGGGTRKVDLPCDFNREDVIRYAVKLFFPEEEYAGRTSDVTYELGNFKQEQVKILVDSNGVVQEFTVQKYCELCKTHQFNLYLLVKQHPGDEDEDKDDKDLLKPVFDDPLQPPAWIPVEEETPILSVEDNINQLQPLVNDAIQPSQALHIAQTSSGTPDFAGTRNRSLSLSGWLPSSTSTVTTTDGGIIGSSFDRLQLREEQNSAFLETLRVDQEKEAAKTAAAQRQQSLEALRSARLSRVPPEPNESSNEDKVVISVRHPAIGTVSRSFLKRERMLAVYDWCGSLSLEPEFFGLYTTLPKTFISPCEPVTSVARTMLYVEEQASPVSLSNDELEVSLRGFGLPHPDPTFQGDETISDEDDDITITWAGLLASATQANLSEEGMFQHHSR